MNAAAEFLVSFHPSHLLKHMHLSLLSVLPFVRPSLAPASRKASGGLLCLQNLVSLLAISAQKLNCDTMFTTH